MLAGIARRICFSGDVLIAGVIFGGGTPPLQQTSDSTLNDVGHLQGSTSREARTTANSASSIRRRVTDRNRLLRTDARLMTSCMPA